MGGTVSYCHALRQEDRSEKVRIVCEPVYIRSIKVTNDISTSLSAWDDCEQFGGT